MTRIRKPLSIIELQPIVADYHRLLPGWKLLENEIIARESGPILQVFGFQRLSTGGYRPVFGIYYLCVPDREARFGVQLLKHPFQNINPRDHKAKIDNVMAAILHEIVPSMIATLVPEEVLTMHEEIHPAKSPDALALAALNAYVGHIDRAVYWCEQFPKLVQELDLGWQEFDLKRIAFLKSLKMWIDNGEVNHRLDVILNKERRKWGLVSF